MDKKVSRPLLGVAQFDAIFAVLHAVERTSVDDDGATSQTLSTFHGNGAHGVLAWCVSAETVKKRGGERRKDRRRLAII